MLIPWREVFASKLRFFSCASPVIAVRLWVCYSWETNSSSFFLVVNPLWNNMGACLAICFFFSSCGCSIKTYQNSPCHLIHLAFQLSLWPICWFWAGFFWIQTEKNCRTFGHWNIERQGQTTTKRTKAKCCAGCAVVLFLWVFVWESPLFGWQPGTLISKLFPRMDPGVGGDLLLTSLTSITNRWHQHPLAEHSPNHALPCGQLPSSNLAWQMDMS